MNMKIGELIRMATGGVRTGRVSSVSRLPGSTSTQGDLLRYALGCGLCLLGLSALAISPAEVQRQLSEGAKITFVDLRSTTLFRDGHIPNAINIPAALIPNKQLPPLGRVVVYDAGLGRDLAPTAVAALSQKPGITAEVLEGGLAAWKMAQSATTQSSGMTTEALPQITYQELKRKSVDEMVLVDLRVTPSPPPGFAVRQSATPSLTSLASEFPGARITPSPWSLPESRQAQAADSPPPLLVLIDNGDGKAQVTARALKASGHARFVILVGGESILERKGAPGLQRAGATLTVQPPPAAAAQPKP